MASGVSPRAKAAAEYSHANRLLNNALAKDDSAGLHEAFASFEKSQHYLNEAKQSRSIPASSANKQMKEINIKMERIEKKFKDNPFMALGVSHNAKRNDVKKSYFKMAKKYHPDKSAFTKKLFVQMKDAYELLNDSDRLRTHAARVGRRRPHSAQARTNAASRGSAARGFSRTRTYTGSSSSSKPPTRPSTARPGFARSSTTGFRRTAYEGASSSHTQRPSSAKASSTGMPRARKPSRNTYMPKPKPKPTPSWKPSQDDDTLWVCGICGKKNEQSAAKCIVCGREPRPATKSTSYSGYTWHQRRRTQKTQQRPQSARPANTSYSKRNFTPYSPYTSAPRTRPQSAKARSSSSSSSSSYPFRRKGEAPKETPRPPKSPTEAQRNMDRERRAASRQEQLRKERERAKANVAQRRKDSAKEPTNASESDEPSVHKRRAEWAAALRRQHEVELNAEAKVEEARVQQQRARVAMNRAKEVAAAKKRMQEAQQRTKNVSADISSDSEGDAGEFLTESQRLQRLRQTRRSRSSAVKSGKKPEGMSDMLWARLQEHEHENRVKEARAKRKAEAERKKVEEERRQKAEEERKKAEEERKKAEEEAKIAAERKAKKEVEMQAKREAWRKKCATYKREKSTVWSCGCCTFSNPGTKSECEMCDHPRASTGAPADTMTDDKDEVPIVEDKADAESTATDAQTTEPSHPESHAESHAKYEGEQWSYCVDEYGNPYYYNNITSESKWAMPHHDPSHHPQSVLPSGLQANDWVELEDNDGNKYYYSESTDQSTWDPPTEYSQQS